MADRSRRSEQRLGRGLAALIGDLDAVAASPASPAVAPDRTIAVADIRPNPANPRRHFDPEELEDLANSIRSHGIVQPIIVREIDGSFELIAGERRWRAAQMASIDRVPVIVRAVEDREALELAIVENVQRSDLDAIEEAEGYRQLMDAHQYTQNDLSSVVGKSRSHVANTLRLLQLPRSVQSFVSGGQLSSGHARALVARDDAEDLAKRIVRDDLSVRQVEALVKQSAAQTDSSVQSEPNVEQTDADRAALEKRLSDALGMRVSLKTQGRGEGMRGSVRVDFRSLEQLDDLCERLLQS